MGDGKESKKKCCGKFSKKGKHCSSCPIKGDGKACKPNKDYCKDCQSSVKAKKEKKDKKNKNKNSKKKKK